MYITQQSVARQEGRKSRVNVVLQDLIPKLAHYPELALGILRGLSLRLRSANEKNEISSTKQC
jgi:hypothetical protein